MTRTRPSKPVLPDCRPLTVATFRDATLVRLERLHLATRCGGTCAGTTTHLDPKDWQP
jgi:hypothetical protein